MNVWYIPRTMLADDAMSDASLQETRRQASKPRQTLCVLQLKLSSIEFLLSREDLQ